MTMALKHKIIGLAFVAALLPLLAIALLTFVLKGQVRKQIDREMLTIAKENLQRIAKDVYSMCEISNQQLQRKVASDLNVARQLIEAQGGLQLASEMTDWQAVNQYNQDSSTVVLPKLLLGEQWLGQNSSFATPTLLTDQVKNLVGGTCTIFQKMNEQGDMLRVATNVASANKTRAIGTYIPATNPNGEPNPVVKAVMSGNTFLGRAYVVNAWYITAYEPIKSAEGQIIGCLYVGVRLDAMETIQAIIKDIKVGKDGYVWVTGSQGDQKGVYIISKDGAADGKNIWSETDSAGNFFIQDIIKQATAVPVGSIDYHSYLWQNAGEPKPREKIVGHVYFEPWDWVIAPGLYFDDLSQTQAHVRASLDMLLMAMLIGGVLILIVVGWAALVIAGKISNPISRITVIAQAIANGNLKGARAELAKFHGKRDGGDELDALEMVGGKDETGQLLQAVVKMTRNLNSLVGQVQKSCIQLVSTSTEFAASSKEQEATANEFSASTTEIAASSKEISATSQQLVKTMTELAEVSNNTAELADAGHSGLSQMEMTMGHLAQATSSISSKLSTINEKAGNINTVITTITKVADQTNLLSLNAAIEAEKAGEYGLGFAVVAREIRRLADQTAVATLDIVKMVKEMQSAVSSGVMEMDKFSVEVNSGVQCVATVSDQLDRVIQHVQGLPPRFDQVSEGMKGQAEGAQQITEAMVQLNEAARHTSDSISEFNEATGQLRDAAQGLQREVAIFKVD